MNTLSSVSSTGIIGIFILLVAAVGLTRYSSTIGWPIARVGLARLEGFQNVGATPSRTLDAWLPAPEYLTKQSSCDTGKPAPYMSEPSSAYKGYTLLDSLKPIPEPRVASGPTSAQCYKKDYARTLEHSSFAQRTNNYIHGYPDSCSAPNHDLILDVYKPIETPFA